MLTKGGRIGVQGFGLTTFRSCKTSGAMPNPRTRSPRSPRYGGGVASRWPDPIPTVNPPGISTRRARFIGVTLAASLSRGYTSGGGPEHTRSTLDLSHRDPTADAAPRVHLNGPSRRPAGDGCRSNPSAAICATGASGAGRVYMKAHRGACLPSRRSGGRDVLTQRRGQRTVDEEGGGLRSGLLRSSSGQRDRTDFAIIRPAGVDRICIGHAAFLVRGADRRQMATAACRLRGQRGRHMSVVLERCGSNCAEAGGRRNAVPFVPTPHRHANAHINGIAGFSPVDASRRRAWRTAAAPFSIPLLDRRRVRAARAENRDLPPGRREVRTFVTTPRSDGRESDAHTGGLPRRVMPWRSPRTCPRPQRRPRAPRYLRSEALRAHAGVPHCVASVPDSVARAPPDEYCDIADLMNRGVIALPSDLTPRFAEWVRYLAVAAHMTRRTLS